MQTKKLKLSFKDALGKTKMVSVDYPKANLNDEIVKAQMGEMINSKVLQTKECKMTTMNKAYMENISRDDFTLA